MAQLQSGYILVVDSVQLHRRQLVKLLNALGYDALEAVDGAHAIRTIQLDPPNLVLLELSLPKVSGVEVCTWIRAHEATRRMPVVICTAGQDRKSLEKAIRAGATDVLVRPISEENLRLHLGKHLGVTA